jgi:hypothetical protein
MVTVRFIRSGVQYGYGYNFGEVAAVSIEAAKKLEGLKVVLILTEPEFSPYETPESSTKKYERRKK